MEYHPEKRDEILAKRERHKQMKYRPRKTNVVEDSPIVKRLMRINATEVKDN